MELIEPAINKNNKIEVRMNKEFLPEIERFIAQNIEFKGKVREINELQLKIE